MKRHVLRQTLLLTLIAGTALPGLAVAPLDAQRPSSPRATPAAPAALGQQEFARLIESLSEPGGYFDTDNLISNERSYLHVMGGLERRGVRGGAYIGVGPDQNFSYIARIRPEIAFIIDVRRDNLLQHLMFKALFARARNRAEYLALLVGRPLRAPVAQWSERPLEAIVAHLDSAAATPASVSAAHAAVAGELRTVGMPLTADDRATIVRFHQAFIDGGLALRFRTHGRLPRPYYPTLRDLLLERDLEGRHAGYLAREADFQFVREMQRTNRIVPVVGDLAGPHALAAIGRAVRERGLHVSALYASNVEDYLLRDGTFDRYSRTVAALPRDRRSVIIRSWFGTGFGGPHPDAVPGHASTQLLQSIEAFAAEREDYRSYRDVVLSRSVSTR